MILRMIIFKHNFSQFHFFVFLVGMSACSLWGQAPQRKQMPVKDFGLWHHLESANLSADGQWVKFKLRYENAMDTLFLKAVKGDKTYFFANSSYGAFGDSSQYFASIISGSGVSILNLKNGKRELVEDGNYFKFSKTGHAIAVSINRVNGTSGIYIKNFHSGFVFQVDRGTEYAFDPTGDKLAYIDAATSSVNILDINTMQKQIVLSNKEATFHFPKWNTQKKQLLFMEKGREGGKLWLYSLDNNSLMVGELPSSLKLESQLSASSAPFFSEDGKKVFFFREPLVKKILKTDTIAVEVWKGTDKWIYPRRQRDYNPGTDALLSVWRPDQNTFIPLATREHPTCFLSGDEQHAFVYSILDYEPQYKMNGDSDFYIKSTDGGSEQLVVKKQHIGAGVTSISPNGNYLAYFKAGIWIIYDIKKNIHIPINGIPHPLIDDYYGNDSTDSTFGCVWDANEKNFYIYDRYDIWEVKLNGGGPKRLTQGRETKTSYRFYEGLSEETPFRRFADNEVASTDLSKPTFLTLEMENAVRGYAKLYPNGIIASFAENGNNILQLRKAEKTDAYIFLEESRNLPRRIWYKQGKEGASQLLYESNLQAKEYIEGNSELIEYKGVYNEILKGILFYPTNYELGKKYPMIVHIYERMSHSFNNYIIPSLYSSEGYNVKNFTNAGYLVLEPDISYVMMDPGRSAALCVSNAIAEVKGKGILEENHIGLEGHSFGGYETSFIITETNIFAAAVAGAPITDLRREYLSPSIYNGQPLTWQIENNQFRMKVSLFDNPEAYASNSPIDQAHKIHTPLLMWAGKRDENVDWHQSTELYLALRRMERKVNLLVFPEENHTLASPENQVYLSNSIRDWFDFYLK